MTDEERQLIQTLADHVKSAPVQQVDRDADALIRQTIGARPDALYILTQTVLVQEMALNQAKQQIEQLKHSPRSRPRTFFLATRLRSNRRGIAAVGIREAVISAATTRRRPLRRHR